MTTPVSRHSIPLPADFLDQMKSVLPDPEEYTAFLSSYHEAAVSGLRISRQKGSRDHIMQSLNTAFSSEKCSACEAGNSAGAAGSPADPAGSPADAADVPVCFTPVPWEPDGFYYPPDIRPGKHPYHEMGLYYIQEPSAMSAVPLMDPQPGERVLDLCAAPGGKTTQIAGRMMQSGLLVSNEIHPARAKILSQNVERMGLSNVLVTNETCERLAARFPAYFDRILVDAPCSGEGMFRKMPEARLEWTPGEVAACAERQRHLLDLAAGMLRPGGRIVYSTCTFSKAEDEDVAASFLADHALFRSGGCSRIFPHRQRGEGHFVAVFEQRQPDDAVNNTADTFTRNSAHEITAAVKKFHSLPEGRTPEFSPLKDRRILQIWDEFTASVLTPEAAAFFPRERLMLFGEQLYLAPEYCPKLDKLKVLRPGLHLGTVQKGRVTPSHALALYLKPGDVQRTLQLFLPDERIAKYFDGEVVSCDDGRGWVLICVDGFSAGWGKASGGTVKNHYPKALRKAIF